MTSSGTGTTTYGRVGHVHDGGCSQKMTSFAAGTISSLPSPRSQPNKQTTRFLLPPAHGATHKQPAKPINQTTNRRGRQRGGRRLNLADRGGSPLRSCCLRPRHYYGQKKQNRLTKQPTNRLRRRKGGGPRNLADGGGGGRHNLAEMVGDALGGKGGGGAGATHLSSDGDGLHDAEEGVVDRDGGREEGQHSEDQGAQQQLAGVVHARVHSAPQDVPLAAPEQLPQGPQQRAWYNGGRKKHTHTCAEEFLTSVGEDSGSRKRCCRYATTYHAFSPVVAGNNSGSPSVFPKDAVAGITLLQLWQGAACIALFALPLTWRISLAPTATHESPQSVCKVELMTSLIGARQQRCRPFGQNNVIHECRRRYSQLLRPQNQTVPKTK